VVRITDERLQRIKELTAGLRQTAESLRRPVQLMEVCGTHAHAVGRYGLRQLLPPGVRLISGPGCPVCVTTAGQIEQALHIARRGATVATFGDLMRVPAPSGSLAGVRAEGADVRVVYSPQQALELAREEPTREVVFVGVGFETTAPGVAAVVQEAAHARLSNFSVLSLHKLVPPALEALVASGEVRIDGFLCPGHVSVVIGSNSYQPLAEKYCVPCVVAGFEPEDILLGILLLLRQIAEGRAEVENAYPRAVRPEGNWKAQALLAAVFAPADVEWRGLGRVPASGLVLREELAWIDAARRYEVSGEASEEPPGCRCGEVLRGVVEPQQCPLFARACAPAHPVGPCMVSSEGTCAAAYKYEREPARAPA
jgi:hydrogenase expression/formation protein HypD